MIVWYDCTKGTSGRQACEMERSKVGIRSAIWQHGSEAEDGAVTKVVCGPVVCGIERGKVSGHLRRKTMNGQDAGSADYRELRLIKESEKSTVHLVQKKDEDQIYIRKILLGGG